MYCHLWSTQLLQALQPAAPEADHFQVCGSSAEAAEWEACQPPIALEDVERLLMKRHPQLYQEHMVRACGVQHTAEGVFGCNLSADVALGLGGDLPQECHNTHESIMCVAHDDDFKMSHLVPQRRLVAHRLM